MFEGIKVFLTAVTGTGKFWRGRRNRAVEELRALWKGQITVRRNFEWIRLYFQYRQSEGRETVDDKTWSDLEMDEVFARIDRTASVIGRQYLYALLRTYENDISELQRRAQLYALFRADPILRESIQKVLYRLRHDSIAYITTLLFEELPRKPKYCGLLYLSSGLFFLALALTIFDPRFLVAAVALALVNLGINVRYGRAVFQHFSDLTQLTTMLAAAGRLARIISSKPVLELDTLRKHKDLAASLNRKVFWLCLDETQVNEFAAAFFGFLNVFGLSRLIAFLRTVDDLRNFREQIRQIFDAIGSLDAHLAAASYLESLPLSVSPTFNPTGTIDVCGICHPLIDNPVGNSIVLRRESALITGSNLAGKTTFIKTIGLNLILARTLFICLAERADLPPLIVRSSIRQEDRVVDGDSYYSRELEEIRGFVDCPEGRFLFLIDEIFRGTNTIERIAIAAATIRYLSHRNLVLVTTHDVELQDLLADCSRMFHFSEQIDGKRYYFDYILRPGPCRSGNAIRLIELRGYPSDIVEGAHRLAAGR